MSKVRGTKNARHDGVGGELYQTRTKERVYGEIAGLKEVRAARARRARERRGWCKPRGVYSFVRNTFPILVVAWV